MNSTQLHLPFSIEDDNTGLTEIHGMLHVESDALRLEYQIKDAIMGIIKSDTKTVLIPYKEIIDVEFKSSFWGTRLKLFLNSLDRLAQIPHTKDNRAKLKIKKRDREIGQTIQTYLEEKLGIGQKQLPGNHKPRPFYE